MALRFLVHLSWIRSRLLLLRIRFRWCQLAAAKRLCLAIPLPPSIAGQLLQSPGKLVSGRVCTGLRRPDDVRRRRALGFHEESTAADQPPRRASGATASSGGATRAGAGLAAYTLRPSTCRSPASSPLAPAWRVSRSRGAERERMGCPVETNDLAALTAYARAVPLGRGGLGAHRRGDAHACAAHPPQPRLLRRLAPFGIHTGAPAPPS